MTQESRLFPALHKKNHPIQSNYHDSRDTAYVGNIIC